VELLKKSNVPEDVRLKLSREHKNITLALYAYYADTDELTTMIRDILGKLLEQDIEGTTEHVKMCLFGNDMNPDRVIAYYMDLKKQFDDAVRLLPQLYPYKSNHSINTLLKILGDTENNVDMSIAILQGKDLMLTKSDLKIVIHTDEQVNTNKIFKCNIDDLREPKWRYIYSSKKNKELMDCLVCLTTYAFIVPIAQECLNAAQTYKQFQDLPLFIRESIDTNYFKEEIIKDQMDKLKKYATSCNVACTLALSTDVLTTMQPLILFKDKFLILKDESWNTEELFYTRAISNLLGNSTLLYNDITSYHDYLKYVDKENMLGYTTAGVRFYKINSDHRILHNLSNTIMNQQHVVAYGGTRKHKNKVIRTLKKRSHERQIN